MTCYGIPGFFFQETQPILQSVASGPEHWHGSAHWAGDDIFVSGLGFLFISSAAAS
jgi:hypothetical protein